MMDSKNTASEAHTQTHRTDTTSVQRGYARQATDFDRVNTNYVVVN